MKKTFAAAYLALSIPAFCQIDYQTGPDFKNLYERVSGSEFVVTAQATGWKTVIERQTLSEDELEARSRAGTMTRLDGGPVFMATVTGTLCRQSDFQPGSAEPAPLAGPVYLFVPESEPQFNPSLFERYRRNGKEFLLPGSEYLLFLRRDPKQEEIFSKYELDPKLTYYRGFELARGAVRLPAPADRGKPGNGAMATLSAVTAFCAALQPGTASGKIGALTDLKTTRPELQEAADAAIRALQP
jgi:hypothetical protein